MTSEKAYAYIQEHGFDIIEHICDYEIQDIVYGSTDEEDFNRRLSDLVEQHKKYKEESDWEKESDIWHAFYTTFNDDNLRHATNAFNSNALCEKTAKELHQENVKWFAEIMEHGISADAICADMPEASLYREEGEAFFEKRKPIGARQIDITKEDVRCCDDLMCEDNCINATYELWFSHFKYFGIKYPYKKDELSYVNFYTDWHPGGTITASYTVYSEEKLEYGDNWELTDEEMVFFRNKMEQYCQERCGMSLSELWEKHNN